MFKVAEKLKTCKKHLGDWSRRSFGSVTRQLREKKQELAKVGEEAIKGGSLDRIRKLKAKVNFLLEREARLWRQRSRVMWLSEGDRNTHYFHGRASQRRRRNKILGLKDEDGIWREDKAEVAGLIMQHFDNILRTSLLENIEEAVAHVPNLISHEVNDSLTSEFTAREMDLALKQMAPLKALGPDGMPPLFFQKYWKVVGPEVTQGVLSCFNSGHILHAINHTFITFIPKVKTPAKITEFRPISLCNVIYKLISKVIANRLKGILPSIISEAQSAFVPGRLIMDNVLVAFETLHHMHSTKIGREGAMAMKLDMSKAYDWVEWSFLETIMRKMGFHPKWVSLFMNCISTVSYSILVNGEPHGFLKPSRGIRQGDPISPYLFLLCAEGLHYLISNAKD